MNKKTREQKIETINALRRVAETQAAFWDAMSELERAMGGIELDSSRDFTGYTEPTIGDIDEIIEYFAEHYTPTDY